MSEIHVDAVSLPSSGGRNRTKYRVFLRETGEVLIPSTTEPFLSACRVLKARNISGRLVMNDHLSVGIDKGGGMTVIENDRHGPKFGKYAPMPDELKRRPAFEPEGA